MCSGVAVRRHLAWTFPEIAPPALLVCVRMADAPTEPEAEDDLVEAFAGLSVEASRRPGASDGAERGRVEAAPERGRVDAAPRLRDCQGAPQGARRGWYTVWRIPDQLAPVVGIHRADAAGWRRILAAIPGHRYRSGQDRLRRFETFEEAVAAYHRERARHGSPQNVRVFDE